MFRHHIHTFRMIKFTLCVASEVVFLCGISCCAVERDEIASDMSCTSNCVCKSFIPTSKLHINKLYLGYALGKYHLAETKNNKLKNCWSGGYLVAFNMLDSPIVKRKYFYSL